MLKRLFLATMATITLLGSTLTTYAAEGEKVWTPNEAQLKTMEVDRMLTSKILTIKEYEDLHDDFCNKVSVYPEVMVKYPATITIPEYDKVKTTDSKGNSVLNNRYTTLGPAPKVFEDPVNACIDNSSLLLSNGQVANVPADYFGDRWPAIKQKCYDIAIAQANVSMAYAGYVNPAFTDAFFYERMYYAGAEQYACHLEIHTLDSLPYGPVRIADYWKALPVIEEDTKEKAVLVKMQTYCDMSGDYAWVKFFYFPETDEIGNYTWIVK